MTATDRDLRSPNWANSWLGRAPWTADNIGRVALLDRRGIAHEELVGIADHVAELRKRYPDHFAESRRRMVRWAHLTLDDDPDKVYVYLPEKADVVYYALGEKTGIIKIGTTKWLGARMIQLPRGRHDPWKLLAIEPGDEYIERHRHGQFGELWIPNYSQGESRELFAPGMALIAHINKLLADPAKWLERADIDHTAARLVFDATVEAPAYTGSTEPLSAEQAAIHQRALLRFTAEESAKFRAKIHRWGAFT